jgi:hypothetical protein
VARRKASRKFRHNGEAPRDKSPIEKSADAKAGEQKQPAGPSSGAKKFSVSQTSDGTWELVHSRCAKARREDMEEVVAMIAAEEYEIATDELRWLLAECHDFLEAHKLLGDLALVESDFRLARGHYGYAYQLGIKAIDAAGPIGSLPYRHEANRAFFDAGRGLVRCLEKLGKKRMARDAVARLLQLDGGDPLGLRKR